MTSKNSKEVFDTIMYYIRVIPSRASLSFIEYSLITAFLLPIIIINRKKFKQYKDTIYYVSKDGEIYSSYAKRRQADIALHIVMQVQSLRLSAF